LINPYILKMRRPVRAYARLDLANRFKH